MKLFLRISISILSGFIAVSVFSQDFSGFRKANNGVYVIAHRGVHKGIPENSLPAYQKAIELGCDFVEIDIRTTKDGRFVSIHNSAIDSYMDGKTGAVRDMTLAELKDLDIGLKLGYEWKNTRIPTLEEILLLCRGKIGIYLDLKDASVPELMKIIREFGMEKEVVWYISFPMSVQLENTKMLFGNSFIMPDPMNEANLIPVIEKLNPAIVATDMGVLTRSFVTVAHKHGAMVFADDETGNITEWKKMIDCGVDGIQTDNPGELIEFLSK